MNIVLFDEPHIRESLLPLTFTRPVGNIRIGILTIQEKWSQHLNAEVSFKTEAYLSDKFPHTPQENSLFINGALCPNEALISAVKALSPTQVLMGNGKKLAYYTEDASEEINFDQPFTLIDQPWLIFKHNAEQIKSDFHLITSGRQSAGIADQHTVVYGEENLFVEPGAKIRAAIINAENGPVYIGKNATVHEGAIISGAFALCEGAHVNMGAKIKGDSTIGPFSKVGGEVSNSVIFGYSNKSHDGFIGNTVIGEWCNLGADTNTSNLKNNYANVKIWDYNKGGFKDTGETFCGLIMGDHAKCGINTMFNTGTVVGVSANIFGSGFPRNFIPSFSWGGASGFSTFQLRKADEVAERVMARRSKEYSAIEKAILKHIFECTAEYRIWDKRSS